jgi:formate/nitrite transporter FocA (FNT family)
MLALEPVVARVVAALVGGILATFASIGIAEASPELAGAVAKLAEGLVWTVALVVYALGHKRIARKE